jgi:pimeloyl-ACP methyl ester carboxylesterase
VTKDGLVRVMTEDRSPSPTAGPGHWDAVGPADAPAIVFVHGALMSRAVWRPQLDALSARYRCVSVDLPGHGTLAAEAFTIEQAIERVTAAVDAAGGGRAVLVGLSLGGYTAMAVAGKHPERVRGLVIAGSSTEPAGVTRLAFQLYGWALRLTPERVVRLLALRWFLRRYGPVATAAITAGGYFARGGSLAVRRLIGGRFRERLQAYGGPILVINGTLDLVFRLGAGRFLAGVPGVTRHTIAGASHLVNVDKPDRFSSLVESFVETLGP